MKAHPSRRSKIAWCKRSISALPLLLFMVSFNGFSAGENIPNGKPGRREELMKEFAAITMKAVNRPLHRSVSITNSSFMITDVQDPKNDAILEHWVPITAGRRFSIKITIRIARNNKRENGVLLEALDGEPIGQNRWLLKGKPPSQISSAPNMWFTVTSQSQAVEISNIIKDLWTELGFEIPYGILDDVYTGTLSSTPSPSRPINHEMPPKGYLTIVLQMPFGGNPSPFGGTWVIKSTHDSNVIGYRVEKFRNTFTSLGQVDGEIAPGTTITLGPQRVMSASGSNDQIVYKIVSAWYK